MPDLGETWTGLEKIYPRCGRRGSVYPDPSQKRLVVEWSGPARGVWQGTDRPDRDTIIDINVLCDPNFNCCFDGEIVDAP